MRLPGPGITRFGPVSHAGVWRCPTCLLDAGKCVGVQGCAARLLPALLPLIWLACWSRSSTQVSEEHTHERDVIPFLGLGFHNNTQRTILGWPGRGSQALAVWSHCDFWPPHGFSAEAHIENLAVHRHSKGIGGSDAVLLLEVLGERSDDAEIWRSFAGLEIGE